MIRNPTQQQAANVKGIGFILQRSRLDADRAFAADLDKHLATMGGAWPMLTGCFPPQMQFAIAIAGNVDKRLKKRAPLILYAADAAILPAAIREACTQVDGIQCAWVHFLDQPYAAIVERELLRDTETEGRA